MNQIEYWAGKGKKEKKGKKRPTSDLHKFRELESMDIVKWFCPQLFFS